MRSASWNSRVRGENDRQEDDDEDETETRPSQRLMIQGRKTSGDNGGVVRDAIDEKTEARE